MIISRIKLICRRDPQEWCGQLDDGNFFLIRIYHGRLRMIDTLQFKEIIEFQVGDGFITQSLTLEELEDELKVYNIRFADMLEVEDMTSW